MKYKTKQEQFWAGKFGDSYIARNKGNRVLSSSIALFGEILSKTRDVKSAIEFGANIGLNLRAIEKLNKQIELSAIEINRKAVLELQKMKNVKTYSQSILDYRPDYPREFVFTKGVLIHLDPVNLPHVYDILYESTNRYICIIEYYNPTPIEILYRGHRGKLYKRDFAGEILDRHNDVILANYGFVYHRDNNFPQDDVNWFLLERIRKQ